MILPQTAEYALRAMALLATRPQGTPIKAMDLAVETGIPVHYLSKIMRKLVEAGLVSARKGHGGGFCLTAPLETITFKAILNAANYSFEHNRCVFGFGQCSGTSPCPLHYAWSKMSTTFERWAETSTLADIRNDVEIYLSSGKR